MTRFIGLFAIALAIPSQAFAWGKDGHDVVGIIAEKNLSRPAAAAVAELLKDHQFKTLSDTKLVNWADSIRGSAMYKEKYPKSALWHYIDIDVEADLSKVDLVKYCEADDCVYGALKKFQSILKDPKKTLQERREALFFIAHFIGDFHQPLHCAERNKDKGGNLVKVKVKAGDTDAPNLHKVWDSVLVAQAMGTLSSADYADRLLGKLDAEKTKAHQKGTLEDWILECHILAREKVYIDSGVAVKAEGHTLSEDYGKVGAAVAELQLLRGGLRLAQFLNDTFPIAEDVLKTELKALEGTWQLESAVTDGKAMPAETIKKIRVVIKAGKHTVYFGDEIVAKEIPFQLDPTQKPKTTEDSVGDGKTIQGIYKLEGDTLTSCTATEGKDRPTEFAAKAESGHTLRVFKRVKD